LSVYPAAASSVISARACVCGCWDRPRRYPSDMTDAEWVITELLLPAPACSTPSGGRPEKHHRRAVVDAIRYLVKYGIEWRALPVDYPPWRTVYGFFERWAAQLLPPEMIDELRRRLRIQQGRELEPTAAIIDAQSIKCADTVGAATSGYDAGKKIKGRKRHIAVDVEGWLLAIWVSAASVQDRDGARPLLRLLADAFATISLVWADGGYAGKLVTWTKGTLAITVRIVKRSDDMKGFVVLPRRWVVERTFGWIMRHRRCVRDYERRPEHHEAMVQWAMIIVMTRRLARYTAGTPAPERWGGPRARPPQQDQQAA
jgi:transposase